MQVKVFESDNMQSALKMVKEALGPDAMILSTRTLRKPGAMGLFGKTTLEVTAAAPGKAEPGNGASPPSASEAPAASAAPQASPAAAPRPQTPSVRATVGGDDIGYSDLWKQRKVIDPLEEEIRELKRQLAGQDIGTVRNEINELKALVREVAVRQVEQEMSASGKPPEAGELTLLSEILSARGVDSDVIQEVGRRARESFTPRQLQERALLLPFVRQALCEMVRVTGPLLTVGARQKRIALVGATGVGKTTTLAKLAADFLIRTGKDSRRVALVTIDTFRIAAVEQLKVYGGIMNLPVEVVFTPEQLQRAFAAHRDKDLILIDTAGRSPKDEPSLRQMEEFLGPEAGTENHLVLSAATGARQLQEAARRFSRLPLHSLILTKLDESDCFGSLFNIPVRHNLPISYLTHGQRVPEDLMLADIRTIADYVLEK